MINTSAILRLSSYWSQYLIVRWQLLLTILVLWISGVWLKSHYGEDDSNLWLVMNQFIALVRWTIFALFSLSILTVLVTWGFFLFQVKNGKVKVSIGFGDGQKAEAGYVPLTVLLEGPVIRPLLGTIRARLVFVEKKMSDPLILDMNIRKKGSLIRYAIRGTGKTLLHDRGIYDVEKVYIRFCDMFTLVALPFTMPVTRQLYTLPKVQADSQAKAQPNSTEEQTHRIEIPRRVEGEFINYKEFETGDNIRRIVWKIYAKSGELVVRIPETKDPYASHLYFYTSFYCGIDPGIFETELLNVYKDKIRNLFEALEKNGYDIRMPQDQEVPKLSGMSDKNIELFQITAARWQKQNPPVSYVEANKAAFVCLSALTPVSEIEPLLNQLPLTTPVVVVKLSDAIDSPFKIKLGDIFFSPEEKPQDPLRNPWFLSPLRSKIQKNENDILKLLNQRGNGWVIKAVDLS